MPSVAFAPQHPTPSAPSICACTSTAPVVESAPQQGKEPPDGHHSGGPCGTRLPRRWPFRSFTREGARRQCWLGGEGGTPYGTSMSAMILAVPYRVLAICQR